MSLLLCDTTAKVESILQNIGNTPSLKTVVLMTSVSEELKSNAQEAGVQLVAWEDMLVRLESSLWPGRTCW